MYKILIIGVTIRWWNEKDKQEGQTECLTDTRTGLTVLHAKFDDSFSNSVGEIWRQTDNKQTEKQTDNIQTR